jgi:coproporphyrinogen III oxidase-like Fe-S oxidoreductase
MSGIYIHIPFCKQACYYCNFHFRKTYYRYSSNGSNYEDFYDILDERYRMNGSIIEESLNLKSI